jgi:hypothetical protein
LEQAIRPLETRLKLLWIGVFPAFGIYAFLAHTRAAHGAESGGTASQMLPISVFLGLTVLVQSFVLRWFTLSPRAIVKMLKGTCPLWVRVISNARYSQTPVLKQDALEMMNGDERKLYEYSACLFGSILVQWGLINTCALFGMILPPVQYQPLAAIVAGVLSAACMLFQFPSIGSSFAAALELTEFERGINRET